MNPLKNENNQQPQMTYSLDSKQFVEQMLRQNPNMRQTLESLQNLGKSPKELALQMAKERGIDINQLIQFANRLGLH